MYITITAQKIDHTYAQSASAFVDYLEKENEGKDRADMERFFNHYTDDIQAAEVIHDIDRNTAKLKKKEPKFYSITLNPSSRELHAIDNAPEALKRYTREVMKDYAKAFNREIDGRPVTVDDLKYYAKVERQRTFKGSDQQIIENQPYATKILLLKQEIRGLTSSKEVHAIKKREREIERLEREAPHQLDGKRIVRGMSKPGPQSHVHIIVSRKDRTNRYSLSPGSKYKASDIQMNGKWVKRGFDRDSFFKDAEKTFDALFKYQRNYVETYTARKTFHRDPKLYFSMITKLPANDRTLAFQLLHKIGVDTTLLRMPTTKLQMTLKAINLLKRGVGKAIESGSIGI